MGKKHIDKEFKIEAVRLVSVPGNTCLHFGGKFRTPEADLIHHSDLGSQYASGDHQKIISKHGITCSMSRKGNCYDNAIAESFFRLLKTEWVYHYRYLSRSEATHSLFYYIEIFYNRKRRHSALGYATPQEYETFSLAI